MEKFLGVMIGFNDDCHIHFISLLAPGGDGTSSIAIVILVYRIKLAGLKELASLLGSSFKRFCFHFINYQISE